jgi:hypothetical protein
VVVTPYRLVAASTAVLLIAVALAGCSAGQPAATSAAPTASPPGATSPSSAAPSPDLTPVPGGSTAATPGAASQATQTDSDWGRIWDAVPAWFPIPPDAVPTETGEEGAVSASLAAGGSAQSVAQFMQTGLTGAGFSFESLEGPAEDGSLTLNAVGPDPACKVQLRVRPLSGTTNLVVLYGAACPAP